MFRRKNAAQSSLYIAAAYFLIGAVWIIVSDTVVAGLFPDTASGAAVQTAKGWFYVAITAILLFFMIKRQLRFREQRIREEQRLKLEREALLRELHHRVKNNLQLMLSLINLQHDEYSAHAQTVNALDEVYRRFTSISMIHEQTYAAQDFAEIDIRGYLDSLIDAHLGSQKSGSRPVAWTMSIDPVAVPVDKAVSIGLLFNEIILASEKTAGLRGIEAEVQVSMRCSGTECRLEFACAGEQQSVFGFRAGESLHTMIIASLIEQLEGRISTAQEQARTSLLVVWPLETKPAQSE